MAGSRSSVRASRICPLPICLVRVCLLLVSCLDGTSACLTHLPKVKSVLVASAKVPGLGPEGCYRLFSLAKAIIEVMGAMSWALGLWLQAKSRQTSWAGRERLPQRRLGRSTRRGRNRCQLWRKIQCEHPGAGDRKIFSWWAGVRVQGESACLV